MRTLLVEDDEMIGSSLRHALEGAGWSVDWVRDGALAQSAFADGGYTCVLLDLGLPRQDGTEVLRRARERGDTTPVLVLTEGKKRQIRRMCEQVGLHVVGLKRIRIGQVVLGNLPVGQWRYLTADEHF